MAVIDVGSYLPTFLTREDSFPYTYIPEPDRKLLRSGNFFYYVKIVFFTLTFPNPTASYCVREIFLLREDSFPYTYILEPDRKLLRSRNCLPTFFT